MADNKKGKSDKPRIHGMSLAPESVPKTEEKSHWEAGNSPARKKRKKRKQHSTGSEKLQERLILAVVILFAFLVIGGSWAIGPGRLKTFASDALEVMQEDTQNAGNRIQNCRNPKNKNTPYCVERKARIRADWRSIERGGGKASAFTFHDGEKRAQRRSGR